MKKGQLTVFMILGVVILIVFLFILFLVNSVQVGTLEGEKEQVLSQLFDKEGLRIFVEDCLEDNLQDGLELLAQQGTIWEDQGGRKTFIEGIALGENSDEENIRVAYAISHADYTPDNQYPCRDGTPNGFCEYKYPTTTILKGDQHVFLSTLQSNLAQFLQTRTASCVQDKVRADVSEAADFSDEDLTFSTIFRDSGVNVEVHFPMRFSIGGSEEFFQISEFDFFYPTKFKQGSLDGFMKMNHKKEKVNKIEKIEKPKFAKLNKKDKEAVEEISEEERQATLHLAMQYQYYTESEEEEEDETVLSTGLLNIPPSIDNSAW